MFSLVAFWYPDAPGVAVPDCRDGPDCGNKAGAAGGPGSTGLTCCFAQAW